MCSKCDKTYRYKENLKQHVKWHNGEKDYQCTECDKFFSQAGNLKSHIRSIHRAERPFMCSLCDKSFKQKDSLNCHIKRHGVVEKKFQCDVCHKTFAKQAECLTHSAIHSDKRPFKCEFGGCDKAFKISQSLRVHKVTHSGLKPYQCQICENWFSAKNGLKSHIQGVHKKKSHMPVLNVINYFSNHGTLSYIYMCIMRRSRTNVWNVKYLSEAQQVLLYT